MYDVTVTDRSVTTPVGIGVAQISDVGWEVCGLFRRSEAPHPIVMGRLPHGDGGPVSIAPQSPLSHIALT